MRLTPETIRRLEQFRLDLVARADAGAPEIARLIERMERALLRVIESKGEAAIDNAQIADVLSRLGEVQSNGNREVAKWLIDELPKAALNGVEAQAAWAGAIGAAPRVQRALDALKTGTLERVARQLTPKDLAEQWASDWVNRWDSVAKNLQSEVLRSKALGTSWKDLAGQIQNDLGQLDLGLSNPDAFSQAFARTTLTDMATQQSIAAAREVGIEKFVNIGIGDERQSEECAEASEQPPMTLEEWMASKWGIPPRHPNCRCDLGGVPSEIEDEITQGVGSYQEQEVGA